MRSERQLKSNNSSILHNAGPITNDGDRLTGPASSVRRRPLVEFRRRRRYAPAVRGMLIRSPASGTFYVLSFSVTNGETVLPLLSLSLLSQVGCPSMRVVNLHQMLSCLKPASIERRSCNSRLMPIAY